VIVEGGVNAQPAREIRDAHEPVSEAAEPSTMTDNHAEVVGFMRGLLLAAVLSAIFWAVLLVALMRR
jgi:hypothetical protein